MCNLIINGGGPAQQECQPIDLAASDMPACRRIPDIDNIVVAVAVFVCYFPDIVGNWQLALQLVLVWTSSRAHHLLISVAAGKVSWPSNRRAEIIAYRYLVACKWGSNKGTNEAFFCSFQLFFSFAKIINVSPCQFGYMKCSLEFVGLGIKKGF